MNQRRNAGTFARTPELLLLSQVCSVHLCVCLYCLCAYVLVLYRLSHCKDTNIRLFFIPDS